MPFEIDNIQILDIIQNLYNIFYQRNNIESKFIESKKMYIVFIFLLAILPLELVISVSFSSNDICIREQNRCKSLNGLNSELKCEKMACKGRFSSECGLDYCAKSKTSCDSILNLMFLNRSFKRLLLFKTDLEKYSSSIEKISYCAVDAYLLQADDVCINSKGCYSVTRYLFRISKKKITKPINCTCPAKHNFNCGEKFCAVHSDACGAFNQTGSNAVIKNCDNNNQIIEKNFFF